MKCKKSIDNGIRYIAMQPELHDWEQWEMRAKVLNTITAARVGMACCKKKICPWKVTF